MDTSLPWAAACSPIWPASRIAGAVRVKGRIAAGDQRGGGARTFLKFGHTVGHALEAGTEYSRFTHGEAVALGLEGAVALSPLPERDRALKLVSRLRIE